MVRIASVEDTINLLVSERILKIEGGGYTGNGRRRRRREKGGIEAVVCVRA
ncbi:MAG: hypothetical protein IBX41_03105 [Methanophagales archaeon]|nr:hypothetical protein [Methanophagales archaeon]